MKHHDLSRRDLGKLTLAAFGGMLAGSILGSRRAAGEEVAQKTAEAHACCGLNTCKGLGVDAKNECAGQGSCATVEAHGCAGENACKGQGADYDNACKGKGSCAVPVKGDAWKQARSRFESAMKAADKKFGAAPVSCAG